MGALVDVLALQGAPREWQIVTASFVFDAEINTGLLPFRAVGWNLSAASPVLRQKVRQFVQERPVNFWESEFLKLRIEYDVSDAGVSEPRCASHSRIPEDCEFCPQARDTYVLEFASGKLGEIRGRMTFG